MDAGRQNGVPGLANGFVHQALIYASEEEFVDAALPFVREGVEAGEPVLVRVKSSNVDALRAALGAGTGNADLLAAEQWYENPIRTRTKFADWVARRLNGHRIRLLGEPPWPLGSQVGIRDWARHESVINVSFAGLPVTFICPQRRARASALDPRARRGHSPADRRLTRRGRERSLFGADVVLRPARRPDPRSSRVAVVRAGIRP